VVVVEDEDFVPPLDDEWLEPPPEEVTTPGEYEYRGEDHQ
jgi:hypothetical protein